jgi:hypothetical protein
VQVSEPLETLSAGGDRSAKGFVISQVGRPVGLHLDSGSASWGTDFCLCPMFGNFARHLLEVSFLFHQATTAVRAERTVQLLLTVVSART